MARFDLEVPEDIIKSFESLSDNTDKIFGEMTRAGAELVYKNILKNMKSSFKTTKSLEKGLKITKTYKTITDDGINTKVGFYGYDGVPTKKYPQGKPIPLKALAREYGTSTEAKKPFFRKSFNKSQIETEMKIVQDKYIRGES